ncbi:cysteine protease family C26 [Thraustotheca clavata]|uniref:Cysteine protease family C26 n=1 Tax=Thraustotheca clavata TaxID=74557 RepID=A0A1W0AAB1_9STRA|nr:cysteine protease family C26 [Thraustotheca clavata]
MILHCMRLTHGRISRQISTIGNGLHFLIVEGYSPEGREELKRGGATIASVLYSNVLKSVAGPIQVTHDVLHPADGPFQAPDLSKYHGVVWTGCSLTVYETHDIRVSRQIELAKQVYAYGVPQFGSCWAAQIAVFAAGGNVAKNPKGREMGISRKIQLTPEGRSHPMYEGKSSVFDAFTSHYDEITHLLPGGSVLSSNSFTSTQSVAVRYLNGDFWAVQYHPEYSLREMARLIHCRREKLVKYGIFANVQDADKYVEDLEELYNNPDRSDIAWRLGIDEDVLDENIRLCEARNYVKHLVIPYKHSLQWK